MLYRFYTLDAEGHISGPAQDVECRDDDDATTFAATLRDGRDGVEIWMGTRMVARLEQVHALETAWWSSAARKSAADRGKFGRDKAIVLDNVVLRGWRWGLGRISGIRFRHRAGVLRILRTVQALQVAGQAAFIEKRADAPACSDHR